MEIWFDDDLKDARFQGFFEVARSVGWLARLWITLTIVSLSRIHKVLPIEDVWRPKIKLRDKQRDQKLTVLSSAIFPAGLLAFIALNADRSTYPANDHWCGLHMFHIGNSILVLIV
jgi:hypothetical protein